MQAVISETHWYLSIDHGHESITKKPISPKNKSQIPHKESTNTSFPLTVYKATSFVVAAQ